MRSLVRPELSTAAGVHCVAMRRTPAAVDNSAPSATRPQSTYKSGKAVQTSGATSEIESEASAKTNLYSSYVVAKTRLSSLA